MPLMARAGFAHGDLSAYNLLVHEGRLVMIDLPQIVDLAANPQGPDFLTAMRQRVHLVRRARRRPTEVDLLFGDLVAEALGAW